MVFRSGNDRRGLEVSLDYVGPPFDIAFVRSGLFTLWYSYLTGHAE